MTRPQSVSPADQWAAPGPGEGLGSWCLSCPGEEYSDTLGVLQSYAPPSGPIRGILPGGQGLAWVLRKRKGEVFLPWAQGAAPAEYRAL